VFATRAGMRRRKEEAMSVDPRIRMTGFVQKARL
jgi:hypothetical protein